MPAKKSSARRQPHGLISLIPMEDLCWRGHNFQTVQVKFLIKIQAEQVWGILILNRLFQEMVQAGHSLPNDNL